MAASPNFCRSSARVGIDYLSEGNTQVARNRGASAEANEDRSSGRVEFAATATAFPEAARHLPSPDAANQGTGRQE